MSPYPAPAEPARPRVHHAPQPGADGVDAHRPRGGRARLRADGRVLRRARARRRRPDGHRRHRAQRARAALRRRRQADHRGRGGAAPDGHRRRCTRRAAGSRCRSCTSGATPTTPTWWRRARSRPRSAPSPPHALDRRRGRGRPSRTSCGPRSWPRQAGYDGVEIMGSEGYLINEFIVGGHQPARRTGGAARTRTACASPLEIVRRARERVGPDFILIYRLSMLDLVPGGSTLEEVVTLAKEIEAAGATIINTGIGWHEARIPTIATSVPRGAFTWVTERLMGAVSHPAGDQQPHQHPRGGRGDARRRARRHGVAWPGPSSPTPTSSPRRPRAGPTRSTPASAATRPASTTPSAGRSPPVWSIRGPATRPSWSSRRPGAASASRWSAPGRPGWPAPVTAAERGHAVTLFDAADEIGGQLNIARAGPGQGGVRRDAALLPYAARASRVWSSG